MARALGVRVITDLPGLDAIEKTAKKRGVTLKAVKAGAKLVQTGAKSRVVRRSGALKQALGIKPKKGTRGKTLAYAVVGARTKVVKVYKGKKTVPAYYAHLVEKGTKPHSLLRKAALGKLARAAAIRAGFGRRHPGAKSQPFLKPALDTQQEAIGAAILRVLQAEILKAAKTKKG